MPGYERVKTTLSLIENDHTKVLGLKLGDKKVVPGQYIPRAGMLAPELHQSNRRNSSNIESPQLTYQPNRSPIPARTITHHPLLLLGLRNLPSRERRHRRPLPIPHHPRPHPPLDPAGSQAQAQANHHHRERGSAPRRV